MTPEPVLHRRVAEHLRTRILDGTIPSGSRVPSERVLSEQFSVSRVTVRQAMKDLEANGLLEVVGGVRWVRSEPPAEGARRRGAIEEGATGLVSFSHLAEANGLTATSQVVSLTTRPASLDEADQFSIAPGAPLVELVRLRSLDGIAVLLDFSVIPETLAPGIASVDFTDASLYTVLSDRYGLSAVSAECAIEARSATPELAAHLGLAPGDPVLQIDQTTYDAQGRVIQWCRSVYRGDRYRFRAVLEGSAGTQMAHRTAAEIGSRAFAPEFGRSTE